MPRILANKTALIRSDATRSALCLHVYREQEVPAAEEKEEVYGLVSDNARNGLNDARAQ
jgi:hypothetical protein